MAMAIWGGKTDAVGSRPSWVNLNNYPAGTQLVFVDVTEAQQEANKKKGITGAGWWLVREYVDSTGTVRYKVENVVSVSSITAGVSGDSADDTVVADVNAVVTISVQPANQTTVAGEATFGVTAAVAPSGTATYQWQLKTVGGRWTPVVRATSATLDLSGQTVAQDGDQYRVVVGSDNGAAKVTSTAAALTFGT